MMMMMMMMMMVMMIFGTCDAEIPSPSSAASAGPTSSGRLLPRRDATILAGGWLWNGPIHVGLQRSI